MSEHFPKLMTENRPQIQEVQRKSSKTIVFFFFKKALHLGISFKLKMSKKKILKEVRGGKNTYLWRSK